MIDFNEMLTKSGRISAKPKRFVALILIALTIAIKVIILTNAHFRVGAVWIEFIMHIFRACNMSTETGARRHMHVLKIWMSWAEKNS